MKDNFAENLAHPYSNPMIRRLSRFSQMKSQTKEPEKNLCESV